MSIIHTRDNDGMKRRVVIETFTSGGQPHQEVLNYDDGPGGLEEAVRTLIWSDSGLLSFTPIEGESNYEGWSRFTVNISGPICTGVHSHDEVAS